MTDKEKINDVIRLLKNRQEKECDPVRYARFGEAVWTLQDLRGEIKEKGKAK